MEAAKTFKHILTLEKNSNIAKSRLQDVHSIYVTKGDDLFHNMKMKPAVDNYEKSLQISERPRNSAKKTA